MDDQQGHVELLLQLQRWRATFMQSECQGITASSRFKAQGSRFKAQGSRLKAQGSRLKALSEVQSILRNTSVGIFGDVPVCVPAGDQVLIVQMAMLRLG